MPEGDMPIANLVPQEPLEQDSSGSLFGQEPVDLTQEYLNQMPTTTDTTVPGFWNGITGKTGTFFFGKLIYESLGNKEEIMFCALVARKDSKTKEFGSALPDTGDPDFMFITCPKWTGITELGRKVEAK